MTPAPHDDPRHHLTLTRRYGAPRELVFRMWTDPGHMANWLGPDGFTATSVQLDVRPGGAWRTCIREDATGVENWSSGLYREISPPERLVFTFAWEQDGVPGDETLVTITFADLGGTTELTFVQGPFPSPADRDAHADGWGQALAKLAASIGTL